MFPKLFATSTDKGEQHNVGNLCLDAEVDGD